MPEKRKNQNARLGFEVLARLVVALVVGYLSWRFVKVYLGNLTEESGSMAGLARFFLGNLLELLITWGVAHANFRLVFLRLYAPGASYSRMGYWAWMALLALLWFFVLEWRTGYEPEFADENVLLTLLIIAFVIAYGYSADYFRTRRLQLALMKEKSVAELNTLKAQIKPHFLFNTLNVLYNSAQKQNDERTAQLIHELSQLMRFSIQEAGADFTELEQELNFIERYIHFQRLRLPVNAPLDLKVDLSGNFQGLRIAPLLLIPFVENAFQYGISLNTPCFIHLDIAVQNQQLSMQAQNSIASNHASRKGLGTGISNTRERLKLIYPHRHTLILEENEHTFLVKLDIDLNPT